MNTWSDGLHLNCDVLSSPLTYDSGPFLRLSGKCRNIGRQKSVCYMCTRKDCHALESINHQTDIWDFSDANIDSIGISLTRQGSTRTTFSPRSIACTTHQACLLRATTKTIQQPFSVQTFECTGSPSIHPSQLQQTTYSGYNE